MKVVLTASVTLIIGLLIYNSMSTLPEEFEYPMGMKFAIWMFDLAEILGQWSYQVGFSRWTFLRLMSKIIPLPEDQNLVYKRTNVTGVPVILVYPRGYMESGDLQPALVYFHGGGFVSGDAGIPLALASDMARKLGIQIILPEYRLAPEHPFPAPYHDCLNVIEKLFDEHLKYNIDVNKIAIAGDSAGGNLALAVALHSNASLSAVVLLYPFIQAIDFTLPSFAENEGRPFVSRQLIGEAWLSYMGLYDNLDLQDAFLNNLLFNEDTKVKKLLTMIDPQNKYTSRKSRRQLLTTPLTETQQKKFSKFKYQILNHVTDSRFAPLISPDKLIKRLPPVHVVSCEYDMLRDDAVILVERLKKLHIDVTHQHIDFGFHGIVTSFPVFPQVTSDEEIKILYENINRLLN